jgi:histidine ammonia-lyase
VLWKIRSPASVDSLTTSAGTEDHVSMGGFSARKCLRVVEHVEQGKSVRWLIDHWVGLKILVLVVKNN